MLRRHVPFLKNVFFYSLTAFGGPHGHLGMMIKTFVQKRKDVTEEELIEYNAFSQMLPGPSSTQTIMLIAYKRGGALLAILSLLLWIMPASVLMTAFSFLIVYNDSSLIQERLFYYIHPMSVGFVFYAAIKMMPKSVKVPITWIIMIFSALAIIVFKSPWVFPVILITSGILTNFSKKRIPDMQPVKKKIKWMNLWLFAAIFIIIGFLSELARQHSWSYGRIINLFENFYRFGTFVFGGGQALIPMMLIQFVSFPQSRGADPYLSSGDIMTGFGLIQAMPGPVFAVCAYIGAIAMSSYGPVWQLLGSITGVLAVFLPSTLLLLFLFPVYQNLKQQAVIYRALEGMTAAIIGVIWASGILLFMEINKTSFDIKGLFVIVITFCILKFTKIPAPFIVLLWLIIGYLAI